MNAMALTTGFLLISSVATAAAEESRPADDPKAIFAKLESRLGTVDDRMRRKLVIELAAAAFDAGEWTKASRFAAELVSAPQKPESWSRGNDVHIGHVVLGRLALRDKDVATAKKHLLEAGRTPGSPQLNSFGPNMLLAKELLERGERKVVIEYFLLCSKFWKLGASQGTLADWAQTVEKGEIPKFRANLAYQWFNPKIGSILDATERMKAQELTAEEQRQLAEIMRGVREGARKELLGIYTALRGAPGSNLSAEALENGVLAALPRDDLRRAVLESRAGTPPAPGSEPTPARRYADLHRGMTDQFLAEMRKRVPPDRRMSFIMAHGRVTNPRLMGPLPPKAKE